MQYLKLYNGKNNQIIVKKSWNNINNILLNILIDCNDNNNFNINLIQNILWVLNEIAIKNNSNLKQYFEISIKLQIIIIDKLFSIIIDQNNINNNNNKVLYFNLSNIFDFLGKILARTIPSDVEMAKREKRRQI